MTAFFRGLRIAGLMAAACLTLSGCLSMKFYVDPALPLVSKGELLPPPSPQPAHVLFEFRTKGNANTSATSELKGQAIAAVAESGLFSSIAPAADDRTAGQLKITIDNVVITDNAAAKGFGTGLTFGLAGSQVTDGYVCNVEYVHGGKTTSTTVKHALHTTIGNHSAPMGLTAMPARDALNQIVQQMIWNALKDLNKQNAFAKE